MYRIFFISFVLLSIFGGNLYAGKDIKYPVSEIPEALKKEAHAVIRESSRIITIKSEKEALMQMKEVVTVLNKNGDSFATFYEAYDPNIQLTINTAVVYDAEGKQLKKIKSSDIYDQAFQLYDDSRYKEIDPMIKQYPYTVEYEWEVKLNGYIDLRDWISVPGYNVAVQSASLKTIAHTELKPRYKEYNFPNKVTITEEKGNITYLWKLENFSAIEPEPYSPSFSRIVPTVIVAPKKFNYEGYAGNMNSWKEFGKWDRQLLKERSALPDETKATVKKLIEGKSDKFEIMKTIYEYMQENTRYVSIQYGIGGHQPFPASKVAGTGYGDCKALTNYMKALLEVAGIHSIYTLVDAGKGAIDPDPNFPAQIFNHVFLTVPLEKDTLFLECTNSYSPCGYNGSFTCDRNVLLITGSGGKMIRTPDYSKGQNSWVGNTTVDLSANGDASVSNTTTYTCLQYENVSGQLRKSKEEQKKSIYRSLDLNNFKINSLEYTEHRNRQPSITRKLSYDVTKYATPMGNRIFLPLNMVNRNRYIPRKIDDRKNEVILKMSYIDSDTIIYKLPEGYKPESIPEEVIKESAFGKYLAKVEYDGQNLIYIRQKEFNKGRYPATDYEKLIDYLKSIVTADKKKIVLIKNS